MTRQLRCTQWPCCTCAEATAPSCLVVRLHHPQPPRQGGYAKPRACIAPSLRVQPCAGRRRPQPPASRLAVCASVSPPCHRVCVCERVFTREMDGWMGERGQDSMGMVVFSYFFVYICFNLKMRLQLMETETGPNDRFIVEKEDRFCKV